jgi:hypothetical protein
VEDENPTHPTSPHFVRLHLSNTSSMTCSPHGCSAAVRRFVHSNAVTQYLQRQHGDLCNGRHGTVHLMCYKKPGRWGGVVVESLAGEKGRRRCRSGSVFHAIPPRALQIQVPRYSSTLGVTHQREQVKAAVGDRTPPFFLSRSFLPFVFTRSIHFRSSL